MRKWWKEDNETFLLFRSKEMKKNAVYVNGVFDL